VGSAEEGGLRGYHHRLAGVDRAEKGFVHNIGFPLAFLSLFLVMSFGSAYHPSCLRNTASGSNICLFFVGVK
jgi:hypothetical protein